MKKLCTAFLLVISSLSAHATDSLLTLQHKKADKVFEAAQFVYGQSECFYDTYRHGTITDKQNSFYPGYYYQFAMKGSKEQHRACLDHVRQYFAGRIFHLDSFLLSKDEE